MTLMIDPFNVGLKIKVDLAMRGMLVLSNLLFHSVLFSLPGSEQEFIDNFVRNKSREADARVR